MFESSPIRVSTIYCCVRCPHRYHCPSPLTLSNDERVIACNTSPLEACYARSFTFAVVGRGLAWQYVPGKLFRLGTTRVNSGRIECFDAAPASNQVEKWRHTNDPQRVVILSDDAHCCKTHEK
jgi:hypothetical protein